MKQNRNLRRSKRRKFRNDDNEKIPTKKLTSYTYPKYSDYKLSKIKKNAKRMREETEQLKILFTP